MSNSNDNEERSPRFTKALMGRIVAVGLFVVLGTFAVVHSMMGKNELEAGAEVAVENAVNEFDEAAQPEAVAKTGVAAASTGGLNTSFASQPFAKPAPKPPTSNAFGSKSFGGSTATQGKTPGTTSLSAKPVVTSAKPPTKPPSQPPVRFAQLPGASKPPIGNSAGFAVRPEAAKPPTSPPKVNPSLSNSFGDFGSKAAETADALKGKAIDTANKVTDDAQQKINDAGNTIRNNFSQFGSPQTKPPVTPAKNSSVAVQGTTRTTAPPPLRGSGTTSVAIQPKTDNDTVAAFDTAKTLNPSTPTNPTNNLSQSKPSPFDNIPVRNDLNRRPVSTPPTERSATGNLRPAFPPSGANSPESRSDSNLTSRTGTTRRSQPATPSFATSRPTGTPPVGGNNNPQRVDVAALTANVPGDRELDGVQAPALTVEKVSPPEIQVNRTADFEIVVRNVGRVTADDVKVYDQVPAGTEYVGSVPEADRGGNTLQWQIGAMRPGQEKRIKLQLKPVQPGEIGSIARVTFATQASMRTRVTKPVLDIRHSTSPQVLIGDNVVLDVIVENKGDGPATNVIVQEDVPKQLEFNEGYRELEYEIGTLMPGQSKRVQLGLKAADVGRLKNVMFASADGGLRARHELDMEVVAPKLVANANGPTRRFLQRKVAHSFSVENAGTAKATNVELVARLPSGLRFIGANNQGRYDSGSHAVYWSLAELHPSIKANVELETMPVEVGAQDIKFEALADLNQRSDARQPLAVEHLVDIFFDIDDVVDPIEIGSNTSHRIRVVNQGTKTATNVKLQVDYPSGLQPTSVDGNLRNEIQGQAVIFTPINSMAPGDEISVIVNSQGTAAGDHRVVLNLQADGRQTPVVKQETTRVYADR